MQFPWVGLPGTLRPNISRVKGAGGSQVSIQDLTGLHPQGP